MGSLRNPVGPLPSSIYWRRRAVALLLLALLALLIAWAVSSGDPGAGTGDDGKPGGAGPAPSITPGPSGSGPAISEQPGGRDESGGSGDSTGTGSGDGTGAGAGGDANAGTDGGDGKNGDPGVSGAANGGGAGPAERVAAGSSLPDCAAGAVELTVRSVKPAYAPGERPRFELAVHNSSAVTCKADLGPGRAVLTVSAINDGENDKVWSSKDCPTGGGSLLLKVPAGRTVTHTVDWDRRGSAPRCATPPATPAAPGSYLLEVAFPGASVAPASFRLETD
ncbi:hypothetical protein HHX38_00095 [Streptomyces sp. PKU-MA01144]|uniref:hypothetical protein n=1 Tax=Streptomyces TaxID=1883 RepID=UPI00147DBB76|nr:MULTISPECIES: hypothetical protein [Streptomyces]MCY0981906.1 hypothetical protein [Streptomyces tirandamycinicus]NNJ02554.1 hypothetical protein [Streptomyces sp. PKU-MA01144]